MKRRMQSVALLAVGFWGLAVSSAPAADPASVSLILTARELQRAGKELCVRLDAQTILASAGIQGKPEANAITLKTFSGADAVGVETPCAVFDDIDSAVPPGSQFYVVWSAPSKVQGDLRAEISVDALGTKPRAEPPRNAAVSGPNWVKNAGFELPPSAAMLAGKEVPMNWSSYLYKPDTIRLSAQEAHSGKYSMQLDNPNGVMVIFGQGWQVPRELADRKAKMFYRSYEKVAGAGQKGGCMYSIRCFGAASNYLGSLGKAMPTSTDARGWTLVQGIGSLIADTHDVDFQFYIPDNAPKQTTYVDDFQFQPEAQWLAALTLRPTMLSAAEGNLSAYSTISPGEGVFVGKDAMLFRGKETRGSVPLLLRQDFAAAQLAGAQIRATLVPAANPMKEPLVQAAAPLQMSKEQTLALSVKDLKPGSYEVRLEVLLPDSSRVEAARGTVKIEDDPFSGAPPAP